MENNICLEGRVTKSLGKFGIIQGSIKFGTRYEGPIQKIYIEIKENKYKVILKGGSPIEVDDYVKLYFSKTRPLDSDRKILGNIARTEEDILGGSSLKPNKIEKIKDGKATYVHEDDWPYD